MHFIFCDIASPPPLIHGAKMITTRCCREIKITMQHVGISRDNKNIWDNNGTELIDI